ncbi:uncharacterized protein METZ01_LOCUS235706, partial [marine metagenome]
MTIVGLVEPRQQPALLFGFCIICSLQSGLFWIDKQTSIYFHPIPS